MPPITSLGRHVNTSDLYHVAGRLQLLLGRRRNDPEVAGAYRQRRLDVRNRDLGPARVVEVFARKDLGWGLDRAVDGEAELEPLPGVTESRITSAPPPK